MPRLKAIGGSRAASNRGIYQDHEKDKIIAICKEQVASQAEQPTTQAEQLAAQNNRLNEPNDKTFADAFIFALGKVSELLLLALFAGAKTCRQRLIDFCRRVFSTFAGALMRH
ncbi:hypothetical protein LguiA_029786 [Lonicera macranthoides]